MNGLVYNPDAQAWESSRRADTTIIYGKGSVVNCKMYKMLKTGKGRSCLKSRQQYCQDGITGKQLELEKTCPR